MICPICKSENIKVLESRDVKWNLAIRRRRQCSKCDHRFTTFERIEMSNFLVVKKDWSKENYNRNKIEIWVHLACKKRPISKKQIDEFFIKLEQHWSCMWKEISSKKLWDDTTKALKYLDEVAYIRFISVFRNLDAKGLKSELIKFLNNKS